MTHLLHIDSSPRGERWESPFKRSSHSRRMTLSITHKYVEVLQGLDWRHQVREF